MRRLRALALCAGLAAALLAPLSAPAQAGPHEIVQPSLIYLKLRYTPETGPQVGVPQEAQATGFLVSEDGFILTSYHLLEGMVEAKGINMTLEATVGSANSPFRFTCAVVNSLRPLDLVLLKIRPSPDIKYVPARLGRSESIGDQQMFTSGFHGTQPFTDDGKVSNRLGPEGVGYLWAVNIVVVAGQSGSPVYLSDGTVVGMLKGNDTTAPSTGYMIPIEYADALIAHLRMSAMDKQIARLKQKVGEIADDKEPIDVRLTKVESSIRDVGGYYLWSGEIIAGRLVISYAKLIAGDPQIKNVSYSVFPLVTFVDDQTIKDNRPMIKQVEGLPMTVNADGKGGQIIVSNVDEILRNKRESSPEARNFPALDVVIVPITGGDEKLPPVTIRVPIEAMQ